MCNICKSSLKKSKIGGTLIKKLSIVSMSSALTPPTLQRFLWNAVVYLISPDILSRAQYPLPLASCTGTELQWVTAGITGWVQCFLELVFVLGTAASWERLVLAPCSSSRGEVVPGQPPKGVCAAFLYCSLPSPAFLNVTSSSSSSTAWQSEGQHSQLPACAWNPLLSFNHCLQAVPGCCRNPFSPRD